MELAHWLLKLKCLLQLLNSFSIQLKLLFRCHFLPPSSESQPSNTFPLAICWVNNSLLCAKQRMCVREFFCLRLYPSNIVIILRGPHNSQSASHKQLHVACCCCPAPIAKFILLFFSVHCFCWTWQSQLRVVRSASLWQQHIRI